MDKVEAYLARNFERSLHKSYHQCLQKLGLLPQPASPYVRLSLWRYMRGVPAVFALFTPLAWLGVKVYIVHMVFEALTLHQIDRHFRALLHIVFGQTLCFEFLMLLDLSLIPAVLWAGYLHLSISAWNKHADRLNREAAVPQPAAAAMPGVWPPPPVVSAEDLPKI